MKYAILFAWLAGSWIASAGFAQPLAPAPREPGYIGLVADDRQENGRGVRVIEVVRGAPAELAGLQAGDLITGINGTAVRTAADFLTRIADASAGAKIALQIDRAGAAQAAEVTLGQRPAAGDRRFPEFGRIPETAPESTRPPAGPSAGRPVLGVQCSPVNELTRRQIGLPPGEAGAVIEVVTPGSPAALAGLKRGDVISAIDNFRVRGPEDLAAGVQQAGIGREVELAYFDGNQAVRREIKLADSATLLRRDPSLPSDGSNYPMPPGTPPQPAETKPTLLPPLVTKGPTGDATRVEALEKRVVELEQRIAELERMLRAARP